MIRTGVVSGLLFIAPLVASQVTFRVVQLPVTTPSNAPIYLSGNFEGWTGGQEAYRLEKDADSLYSIMLPQMAGTIQFKFTRGSWASVEKGPHGEEIANRQYTFSGNGATVNVTIHNWADLSTIESTAGDNVHLYHESFYMPQLDRTRRIWLYLPPDYESSQRDYPVMYMHDGQNIFDDSTSFAGEWRVDETLNDLFDDTGFGLIIVGIENGGALRIDEYSPWINLQYGGGEGEAYIDFISETLKPHIDSMFRTMPEAAQTGLMGSSMGGLISHYAGIARPDVFGKLGVFSPSFGLFDSCFMYTNDQGIPSDSKFYMIAGGQEASIATWTTQMRDLMIDAGGSPDHIQFTIVPQGIHNELFWRNEFKAAVEWLFGLSTATEYTEEPSVEIYVYPNPASEILYIQLSELKSDAHVTMFDFTGREILTKQLGSTTDLDISNMEIGVYALRVVVDDEVTTRKVVFE